MAQKNPDERGDKKLPASGGHVSGIRFDRPPAYDVKRFKG
jgi:hypothetical protein